MLPASIYDIGQQEDKQLRIKRESRGSYVIAVLISPNCSNISDCFDMNLCTGPCTNESDVTCEYVIKSLLFT